MSGVRRLAGLLLALCTVLQGSGAFAEAWQKVSDKDGFGVEIRKHEAFPGYAVRVTTRTTLSTAQLFPVLWNSESNPTFIPTSKRVQVLERKPHDRLVYEQLRLPVVKDRDYTVRVHYEHDPVTGLYVIDWKGASEAGPPESSEYVRIRMTEGSWTLEPVAAGGTDVTYVVASESGAAIPQWIVQRAQRDSAVDFVRRILAHTKKLNQIAQ